MSSTLCISGHSDLMEELEQAMASAGLKPHSPTRMRSLPQGLEFLVAISSAGAFSAFYQIITKVLERHKDREIRIETTGHSVSLKGHSLAEEQMLLRELAPELVGIRTIEKGTTTAAKS